MDVRETLRQAVEMGASDIFIIAGLPLTYKVDGRQRRMEARLMPADTADERTCPGDGLGGQRQIHNAGLPHQRHQPDKRRAHHHNGRPH